MTQENITLLLTPAQLGRHDAQAGLPMRSFLYVNGTRAQSEYEAAWQLAHAERVPPSSESIDWSAA